MYNSISASLAEENYFDKNSPINLPSSGEFLKEYYNN